MPLHNLSLDGPFAEVWEFEDEEEATTAEEDEYERMFTWESPDMWNDDDRDEAA